MRILMKVAAAGAGVLAVAGCATYEGLGYGEALSISIPYDPYDFAPDDLQAEADSHCDAYGLRAVYDGETINPEEVRWRYRHFRCV